MVLKYNPICFALNPLSISLYFSAYVKNSTLEKLLKAFALRSEAYSTCPIICDGPCAAVGLRQEWVMCFPFKSNFCHANAWHVCDSTGPEVETYTVQRFETEGKGKKSRPGLFDHLTTCFTRDPCCLKKVNIWEREAVVCCLLHGFQAGAIPLRNEINGQRKRDGISRFLP